MEWSSCAHKLCPNGYRCLTLPNSSFSCIFDSLLTVTGSLCSEKSCLHGGTCVSAYPNNYCLCPPYWIGEDCSVSTKEEANDMFSHHDHMKELHNVAIAVGALVTAFLLAFLIVIFCHCRSTRRWTLINERCKTLLGRRQCCSDIQPILDVSSLQHPRLSPEVIYFTANEPANNSFTMDDLEPLSQLTGKPLRTGIRVKGHGMQHFKI